MIIQQPQPESSSEDFGDIDTDIDSLYNRFIAPIEKIRSRAKAPEVDALDLLNIKIEKGVSVRDSIKSLVGVIHVNAANAVETRTHAFYRMLGLPVVSGDQQSFYNPGFNPYQNSETVLSIISEQSVVAMDMSSKRERQYQDRIKIFSSSNPSDPIAYCLLLQHYADKIQVINANNSDIMAADEQSMNVIKPFYDYLLGYFGDSPPTNISIAKNYHTIKPFMVDPFMDNVVTPQQNIIAAPFLDRTGNGKVRLISGSGSQYYAAPVLENIIKTRVSSLDILRNETNKQFINSFKSGLDASGDFADITATVIEIMNKTDSQFMNANIAGIQNPGNTNLIILLKIYKTIKSLVDLLIDSKADINTISSKISWKPVVINAAVGPESGTHGGPENTNSTVPITKFEKELYQLTVKKKQKDTGNIFGDQDNANYPFTETKKDIDTLLQDKQNQKNHFIETASNCLKNIEIITGKVSGLGLLDILAVYSALFAISIENLISLLDDDAFLRFYTNYPEYRSKEVQKRKASGSSTGSISMAMTELENKIVGALEFAQKCYDNKKDISVTGTPAGK